MLRPPGIRREGSANREPLGYSDLISTMPFMHTAAYCNNFKSDSGCSSADTVVNYTTEVPNVAGDSTIKYDFILDR